MLVIYYETLLTSDKIVAFNIVGTDERPLYINLLHTEAYCYKHVFVTVRLIATYKIPYKTHGAPMSRHV